MFRRNNRRIKIIYQLREQGLTIDQIVEALKEQGEKIPRSSVGYYVRKYCSYTDGTQVKTIRVAKKREQAPSRSQLGYILSGTLPLELPPQTISRKSRSMKEILERDKSVRKMGELLTVVLLDSFENDPDILSKRLDILVKILFLAPYLRIDVEEIIDNVSLMLLGRPREEKEAR
jgi:DNA-binding transcriptional MerR regulator